LYAQDGRVIKRDADDWTENSVFSQGIARSGESARKNLREYAATNAGTGALRGLAAVVAVAGQSAVGGILNGSTERITDANGNLVEVVSDRGARGAPTSVMRIYFNRVLTTSVQFEWTAVEGGFVLKRQVATAFNGGKIAAQAVVDVTFQGMEDAGIRGELVGALETAVNLILPAKLYAGCLGQALQAVGGFAALVLTGGAISAAQAVPVAGQAAGAVAGALWVAGWVSWTGSLIEAAEACSH
jgi:hypothetical protein